jgi:hypothetical protein
VSWSLLYGDTVEAVLDMAGIAVMLVENSMVVESVVVDPEGVLAAELVSVRERGT